MKFTVESSKLMQFLRAASKIIQQKNSNSVPILSNIMFEVNDNVVKLTASGTSSRIESVLELANSDSNGSFTISEQLLSQSIKELPDQPIVFDIDLQNYDIVLTYNNGFYKFKGESSEAYPLAYKLTDDIKSFSISTDALSKGIKSCKFAASIDEKRPIMTGVCLDFDPEVKGLVYVATDGRILIRYTDNNIDKNGIVGRYCISSSTCSILTDFVLSKEKGDVNISFDENFIKVEIGTTVLFSRLLDGKYPNYNSVIPKQQPFEVVINKLELQGACKRVSVCSDNNANSLLVFFFKDDSIRITANNLELSTSAEETVMCSINDSSMDLKIGFDFNTLSKILDNTPTNEITFTLADQSRGGLIIPDKLGDGIESCALIMPIRILTE